MRRHWSLDDVPWNDFDREKLEPTIVDIIKAASLVERNADEYVQYLRNVFRDDPVFLPEIRRWGDEEIRHGEALGRWAELADPAFNFKASLAMFRARYTINPGAFDSVRGSQQGELLARCIVETGTSAFYSALRDATCEPVLRFICGKIAQDEIAHYKMFNRSLQGHKISDQLNLVARAQIAYQRYYEADDDELALAYHCANSPNQRYDRKKSSDAFAARLTHYYRQPHIERAVRLTCQAVGVRPPERVSRWASWLVLWLMQRRWCHPEYLV